MKSIVCMNCLPPEYHYRAKSINGYWDVDRTLGIASCANCGFERKFVSRKTKTTGQPNPSQQKKIDAIKHFFKDWRDEYDGTGKGVYKHPELFKFEVTPTEYGTFWVSVEDVENYIIQSGGFFHIGKRGALTVHQVYGLCHDKDTTPKHYAYILGGKVSK